MFVDLGGGDWPRVGRVALVDLARGKSEVLTTTKLEYYQPAAPHRSPKAIVMSISDRIDPSTATLFISWFDWHILKCQSELRIRTNLCRDHKRNTLPPTWDAAR